MNLHILLTRIHSLKEMDIEKENPDHKISN